ncbi:MAG TPA: hypothetical protein VG502_00105 [Flexivirga sp.]|uniref:hypothetical protein n=1 Tax=Flexivirga sp. TaxID=1962927 RepID=UPI002CDF5CE0|nr:hypothetical protein [Flexivirga sp.]HWC20672.1 hypothetical protein [Flexivirga sp.]
MNLLPRMERIVQLHRDRVNAMATALLAAFLLLVITDVAGTMSWYGLAATLVAGLVVLGNSDSFSGLLLLAAMVLQWLTSGMDAGSWWVIPAAWLLLVAHVAVALVASGPDQAPIPRAILAVWVPRTILVGLATTLVAALTLLIEPTNNELMPYGATAALLALIVAVLVMIRLTGDEDKETPGTDR